MQVNDILKVVWLDSGLGCADMTEADACAAQLVEVTSYGRLAAIDSRRLVIEHEVGRGEVGHYTVILRGCLLSYTTLREGKRKKGKSKGKRARSTQVLRAGDVVAYRGDSEALGVVVGWEGGDSAPIVQSMPANLGDTW